MTNSEAIKIINQYDCNFYWTDGEKIPTEDLIEAFELAVKALDAQTPRVLTLEEVMQYIGYSAKIPPKEWEKLPLWTESKNGTGVISGYRDVENLRYLIDMGGRDVTYIAYKHWRCWTAKPTDEQREAVPWQD